VIHKTELYNQIPLPFKSRITYPWTISWSNGLIIGPRVMASSSAIHIPRTRPAAIASARRASVWLKRLEEYGNIFLMKKTLHIDEKLLEEARTVSGAATDTETVRLGLEALVRHAAYDRLRALRGSEPAARDVPRRREKRRRKPWRA